MKIGFIGLGNMGAPMARNLIKAGHELLGFDVAPTNVGDITQDSIPKIAEECRIIISMLIRSLMHRKLSSNKIII